MSADLIITNARVITMDKANPFAEAIAISGNRITRVGRKDDVMALKGAKTRVHDNRGNAVIPGIIESHVHLFIGSVELDLLNINAINDVARVRELVSQHRKSLPKGAVVMAIAATHEQFGRETPITRHLLDSMVSDVPFLVGCFDHHTVWANTKALEAAGILKGRNLPVGNEIVMGSDGLATGELREPAAFMPVLNLMPTGGRDYLGFTTGGNPEPPATAAQRKVDEEFLKRGIAHANSLGITSMHNMDGNWYQLELLDALQKRGELNSRMEVPFHHKNFFRLEQVDEAVEFRAKYQGDMLHSGRVKIFMDGVLETLTAQMLDDYPGYPGNKGAPLYTHEEMLVLVQRADSHGLQIATHAIGDGGVRTTLDAYENARKKNGVRDSRHRIEHIELIHPADIHRLAELGVVASLQPIAGLGVPGNPREPVLSRLGDKLPWSYAWQTIRDTGAAVAFSSDWPVAPLDPFLGMQAAMTVERVSPECPDQVQSLMDTIHGFTLAGAHMEFMEDRKGMLKEGYLADVAVLNADMEKTPASEIAKVKPVMTVCDGRVVFESL
ncbi:amidohydrolase [Aestuariivirga sp.]|uniref:amidohydrolase n=1 Tax=Aestuariivirga sp. TaxID=2650926 RepID=UPI0039E5EECD